MAVGTRRRVLVGDVPSGQQVAKQDERSKCRGFSASRLQSGLEARPCASILLRKHFTRAERRSTGNSDKAVLF